MAEDYTMHEYDVVIIGAGGAGLRAAIEATRQGVSVAVICLLYTSPSPRDS